MPKHAVSYRIYYEDTDAGGVVYYANYLKFAERARTEMLRSVDVHQSTLLIQGNIAFVVRHVAVDFRKPARLDDIIDISSVVLKISGASLIMQQNIACQGEHLVAVEVKLAAINAKTFQPIRLPAQLKTAFTAYLPS